MKRTDYNLKDSIAALATPWGESAIAVIRTSGQDALKLADKAFRRFRPGGEGDLLSSMAGFRIVRGIIVDPETAEDVDDVLAAVYRGPNSYTGEDSAEFFVHGSLPGIQRAMEALHKAGFRDANPGEFTLRAFVNGKIDLTRAEAVNEIVTAKSKQAQALALHRLAGSVERAVDGVKRELTELMVAVELQLDYSEDEGEAEDRPVSPDTLEQLRGKCEELAASFATGRLYQQGVRVALAGRDRKSTRLNSSHYS